MRYADSHLHLFHNGFSAIYDRPLLGSDVDVYESLRKSHNIEAGLIVGYEAEGYDPDNNAYIRSLAAERPWMVTLAYVGALSSPSGPSMSGLLADGHAGIALYVQTAVDAQAALDWPAAAWGALDAAHAIVSLNILPEHTHILASFAKDYRNISFLVSHLGLPGSYKVRPPHRDAETRIAPLLDLAPFANIHVKISGLYAVSDPSWSFPHSAADPFLDAILARFGAGRCLWGSDFSPVLEHVSFMQSIAIPWLEERDEATRTAIAGGNLMAMIANR